MGCKMEREMKKKMGQDKMNLFDECCIRVTDHNDLRFDDGSKRKLNGKQLFLRKGNIVIKMVKDSNGEIVFQQIVDKFGVTKPMRQRRSGHNLFMNRIVSIAVKSKKMGLYFLTDCMSLMIHNQIRIL